MTATVSVVVTNFDYARFVGHAIQSALDQRDCNVEVVVVDDGSSDGSVAVIERFGSAVVAVLGDNHGQGGAFNRGWDAASGEIVIFLDADDVLDPDVAMRVVAAFAAHPGASRVQYPLRLIDADGRVVDGGLPGPRKRLFTGDAGASRAALASCPDDIVWQPTSGNAFARPALEAILPMPEKPYRICADYYLSNLAPLHGGVVALDGIGGSYRIHGANAWFAATYDLGQLRADIVRTSRTHRELIGACRGLGVAAPADDADGVRSVTSVAKRLISLRLDPANHPLDRDRRGSLVRLGWRSAVARTDAGGWRRLLFATWFVAAAVVPRRLVPAVARPFIRVAARA